MLGPNRNFSTSNWQKMAKLNFKSLQTWTHPLSQTQTSHKAKTEGPKSGKPNFELFWTFQSQTSNSLKPIKNPNVLWTFKSDSIYLLVLLDSSLIGQWLPVRCHRLSFPQNLERLNSSFASSIDGKDFTWSNLYAWKKSAPKAAALKILQNLAWRFTILKKFIEIYETYLGWPVHYT